MIRIASSADADALFSRPVESVAQTRWERKALASAASSSLVGLSTVDTTPKTPVRRSASSSKTPVAATAGVAARKTPGDRFIACRESMNTSRAACVLGNENSVPSGEASKADFNSSLARSLFAGDDLNTKILAFKAKAPTPTEGHQSKLRVLYTQNKETAVKRAVARHIAAAPERILDAPALTDDYYLNLLDWSSTNTLAVALGSAVYTWDATTGGISLLCGTEASSDDASEASLITSVSWMGDGTHLAVGTASNDVQMWNLERKVRVRSMKGHAARVGALAWNDHILSSGSRDTTIIHHDVRIAAHNVSTLRGHEQEICGLKWSPDGLQLASGGNDNVCHVWDASAATPRFSFTESSAAVKALAWCPWQRHTLATGGGTADRHIRFYNTQSGSLLNAIDTKSQVCSLAWSKNDEKELVSSHGFSQNQLTVWKFPSMAKVTELTGHTARVLHTAVSPDGTTVCSAAADETLRFWKVWDPVVAKKAATVAPKADTAAARSSMHMHIR